MRLRRSVDARARRRPTLVLQQLLARLAPRPRARRRFASLDDLVARTGLRRDELVTLADIGALNAFGYDRRSALWQAERAVRPAGELFDDDQRRETQSTLSHLRNEMLCGAPRALR